MKENISYKTKARYFGIKILCYIKASRIEGAIVAAVFLLLGEWYTAKSFPLYQTLASLFSIVTIVSSGSLINYVFDKELDEKAEKDVNFFNFVSPREMLFISFILGFIGLIILPFIGVIALIIGALIYIVFFIYASPPIRLKTVPPLDCIVNALGFGFLPFFLGVILSRKEFYFNSIIYSIIIGIAVISYYLFISVFDIDEDKAFGVKNSCTKLGKNGTINSAIGLFLSATFLSILISGFLSVLSIAFLISLPLVICAKLTQNINHIRMLISGIFLLWLGTVTFILSILSSSMFPTFIFILILLITLQVVYIYLKKIY